MQRYVYIYICVCVCNVFSNKIILSSNMFVCCAGQEPVAQSLVFASLQWLSPWYWLRSLWCWQAKLSSSLRLCACNVTYGGENLWNILEWLFKTQDKGKFHETCASLSSIAPRLRCLRVSSWAITGTASLLMSAMTVPTLQIPKHGLGGLLGAIWKCKVCKSIQVGQTLLTRNCRCKAFGPWSHWNWYRTD